MLGKRERLFCSNSMPPRKDQRLENSDHDREMASSNFLEFLPNDLIHLILNHLNPVEEINFSILSKTLRSLWVSFPSLDYDFTLFPYTESSYLSQVIEFFRFVDKSLQLRGPCIKPMQLKKLRFIYNGFHTRPLQVDFNDIAQKLLEFALENNVVELEVDISRSASPRVGTGALTEVLQPVFFSQCVRVLKLKGFGFREPDLYLACSSLEIFIIDSCFGLKNIWVSSACSRLCKTEIKHCPKLHIARVDAENVESFSYVGSEAMGVAQVDISACSDSLKDLTLKRAAVYKLLEKIGEYLLLEHLNVSRCNLPMAFNIGSSSLRTLKLKNCNNVMNLEVSSENLESFTYHNSKIVTCDIEISECTSLTNLELYGARRITSGWIRNTIPALTMLEMLTLKSCTPLDEIEIEHDKLEGLVLEKLDTLKKAEIEARNLLHFSYSGRLEPLPLVITSIHCNVIITLKEETNRSDWWFRNLNKFLKYFNHCPSLTLCCSSAEELILPKDYLWFDTFPFPLPDMKHLVVKLTKVPEGAKLVEFVESVLWFVPNPKTVTIVSDTKRYLLKFRYSYKVNRRELDIYCCPLRPFKCWRHHVAKIDLENFEQEDRRILEKLLFKGYLG